MPTQYWIRADGQVAGPFSKEQIVQMGAAGSVRPEDEISADKQKWVPAAKVGGLLKSSPAAAAAPARDRAAKRGRGSRVAAVLVLLVLAGAAGGVAYWLLGPGEKAAPPPPKASPPAAKPDPLAYAPPGTAAVLHLDIAALDEYLLAEMPKYPDVFPAEQVDRMKRFSGKVGAVDAYLVPGGDDEPPLFLVAGRGSLTLGDVKDIVKSIGPPFELPLTSQGNGRYGAKDVPGPVMAIFGNEADDLPDDVILFGSEALLAGAAVKALGTDDLTTLRGLLKDVDRSAPIWSVGELPPGLDSAAPKSIAGHIDPRPKGTIRVTLTFHDEAAAKEIEGFFQAPSSPAADLFKLQRTGAAVTISLPENEQGLLAKLAPALGKARKLARRSMSAANLNAIAKGFHLYLTEPDDEVPPDLMTLVRRKVVPAACLFSPNNPNGPKLDADGLPVPPFDYVYIPLKPTAPGNLMIAYERPELNKNEGTWILTYGGSVRWVDMATFRKQLARTRRFQRGEDVRPDSRR